MQQLIAGNWKMNLFGRQAEALARAIAAGSAACACDLLVCPPFTALHAVAAALHGSRVALGAQDCHEAAHGAFTGDVAAPMVRDAGCAAVILGHSERRQGHGETSAQVCAKAGAATHAGLMPVICVGETQAEREAGNAEQVVRRQIADSVPHNFSGVVAYEPIWAIGTGRTATLDDVAAMHAEIRAALRARLGTHSHAPRILYGGSVTPDNARAILAVPDVGGALVGGASLDAEKFLRIAAAARQG
jgi:triosephosphate isomerase